MTYAYRFFTLLGRRATTLLPFALLLGIAFQDLAAAMKPLVTPMVVLLLALALTRADATALLAALRRPWRGLAAVAVGMVLLPVLASPLIAVLPISPGLAMALALMGCCPPLTSMPAVAGFLGLDRAQAMLITVAGTLAMPFTAPPLALLLFDLDLKIDAADMALRLGGVIGGGLLLSLLLRALVRGRREPAGRALDGIAVLVLLLFAIPIMDGAGVRLANETWRTLGFVFWSSLLTFAYIAAMALLFLPLGRRFALTAAYGGGSRNNALLLAILPATVDPDFFLFIAAVQVPIYTVPTLMAPLCRRVVTAVP